MKDYMKVFVTIKTQADEKRWKEFLGKYFPNHYAKKLLDENLVIDYEEYLDKGSTNGTHIAVDMDGYGYISLKLACYGDYKEVFDFADFRKTLLYETIVKKGINKTKGKVSVINIKK